MVKGLHVTDTGFKLILSYKACFTKGVNADIFKSELYSGVQPYNVESIYKCNVLKLDPNYVAGFTAADGSFSITKPSLTGKWPNYDAYFRIHQNVRDISLIEKMIDVIGCGKIHIFKNGMCNLAVRNKNELADIVIPFFDIYPLNVQKHSDFLYFKKAVYILRKNLGKGLACLTTEERDVLDNYISKMNRNRYNPK